MASPPRPPSGVRRASARAQSYALFTGAHDHSRHFVEKPGCDARPEAELWCSVPARAGCHLSLCGRSLVLAGTKAIDRCIEVVQRVKALIDAGESQVGDEVKLL